MKTKLCRPILLQTKDLHSQLEIDDISVGKLSYELKQYYCKNPQQLILVSLDLYEKIEVGDKIYSVLYGLGEIVRDYGGIDSERNRPLIAKFENSTTQQSYHRNGIWQKGKYEDVSAHNCRKVIATQSQLPKSYIQQFIKEYNKGEVKDTEIEMEELYFHGSGYYKAEELTFSEREKHIPMREYKPKLTNGFITIVGEEPILYTEEEFKYKSRDAFDNSCKYSSFEEWFNNNKK